MATITTLGTGDSGEVSRTTINDNFTNLNTDKIETSVLDTDVTLAADSDTKVATQKATKAYVDAYATPTFDISTSSTPSIVTTAGQRLTIIAKGTYTTGGGIDSNVTVNMLNNAVTVDSCTLQAEARTGGGTSATVSFLYSAVPGAQTNNITFSASLTNIQVLTIVQ